MLYGTYYIFKIGDLFTEETCKGFTHYEITAVNGNRIIAESEYGESCTFTAETLLRGDKEHQYYIYGNKKTINRTAPDRPAAGI